MGFFTRMPLVSVTALGGPFDGQVFQVEAPRPLIPDSSLDEPGWWTDTWLPRVAEQGFYWLLDPETIVWEEEGHRDRTDSGEGTTREGIP